MTIIREKTLTVRLDLAGESTRAIQIKKFATASAQVNLKSGTWGAAVLQLERSNDGSNYYPLEFDVQVSAPGMTTSIELGRFAWLRATVLTPSGTSDRPVAEVIFYGTGP